MVRPKWVSASIDEGNDIEEEEEEGGSGWWWGRREEVEDRLRVRACQERRRGAKQDSGSSVGSGCTAHVTGLVSRTRQECGCRCSLPCRRTEILNACVYRAIRMRQKESRWSRGQKASKAAATSAQQIEILTIWRHLHGDRGGPVAASELSCSNRRLRALGAPLGMAWKWNGLALPGITARFTRTDPPPLPYHIVQYEHGCPLLLIADGSLHASPPSPTLCTSAAPRRHSIGPARPRVVAPGMHAIGSVHFYHTHTEWSAQALRGRNKGGTAIGCGSPPTRCASCPSCPDMSLRSAPHAGVMATQLAS